MQYGILLAIKMDKRTDIKASRRLLLVFLAMKPCPFLKRSVCFSMLNDCFNSQTSALQQFGSDTLIIFVFRVHFQVNFY